MPGNPPITTSNRLDPSFSTLPLELEQLIFYYLNPDHSHAASLARVSRRFREAAEPYMWEHIKLFTKSQFSPSAAAVEQFHGTSGGREKIKRMLNAGNERRWGMVKKATIAPIAGALHAIIQVLDLISPTLESLTLFLPDSWEPLRSPESIDIRLLTSGLHLSFSSLTEVHIREGTFLHAEFIYLLCDAAPNLSFLDLEVNENTIPSAPPPNHPFYFPQRFRRDTNIRRLHLVYKYAPDDSTGLSVTTFSVVLNLLRRSPCLYELSILRGGEPYFAGSVISPIIAKLPDLRAHYFPDSSLCEYTRGNSRLNEPLFPALTELVLGASEDVFPNGIHYTIPELESVIVDYTLPEEQSLYSTELPDFHLVEMTIHPFFHWLKYHPHLNTIHFIRNQKLDADHRHTVHTVFRDELDTDMTGEIRGLTHRGSEVVRVTLPFHRIRVVEESRLVEKVMLHVGGNGLNLPLGAEVIGELEWWNYTKIGTVDIPGHVIEEMLRIEGMTLVDWDFRENEVGEEAWKVLTDWKEGRQLGVGVIQSDVGLGID